MSKNSIKEGKISDLIPDNIFDTKTASLYIGCSRHHVFAMIRKYDLPSYKNAFNEIRLTKENIDEWRKTHPPTRVIEKTDVVCCNCGKEFKLHNFRKNRAVKNYCSRACRKTAVIIHCDWCNNEILRVPAQIENHNFCSTSCMGKYQTEFRSGENSKCFTGDYRKYYGPNWQKQRKAARERDNYTCQLCGKQEKGKQLSVHHKKAFALYGIENYEVANQLSNLITLCHSCHSHVEIKRTNNARKKMQTI